MKSFSTYELVGIAASIVVIVVFFATARFFSFDTVAPGAVLTDDRGSAPIVLPGDLERDSTQARDAVSEGVSVRGTVTDLIIQDVTEGTGRPVENGDTVTVHYVGMLENGQQFDNSYVRGETFTFTTGRGEVIEGWDAGLLGMKEGGERILVIPSDMAYGNRAVGPIPPNSPLLFAIELVSIE